MNAHVLRRGTLTAVSTALVMLLAAAPASAHVSVNPKAAEPGSYAKLTFRVPNERPDASTVKLEVALPADQPLKSVSVKPVPGWKATATKTKLATPLKSDKGDITTAVSKIVWTGGEIKAGEFQEFDVSVGPLPTDAKQMVFKAIQTYEGGEVVRWIDVAPEGSTEEPEHPAPTLKLEAAAAETAPAAPAAATSATPAPTVTADTEKASASDEATTTAAKDTTARTLGGFALAAGLLGILLGFLARGAAGRNKS